MGQRETRTWLGLNKRTQENDLNQEQSPDTSNTAHYNGVVGLLGPRKGKTFGNRPAYDQSIVMYRPYSHPTGDGHFCYTADGTILDWDGTDKGSLKAPARTGAIDVTLTNYTTSTTQQCTAFTAFNAEDYVYARLDTLRITYGGYQYTPRQFKGIVYLGFVVDGNIVYFASQDFNDSRQADADKYDRLSGDYSYSHMGILLPSRGSITKIAVKLEVPDWATGTANIVDSGGTPSGGGDFTFRVRCSGLV